MREGGRGLALLILILMLRCQDVLAGWPDPSINLPVCTDVAFQTSPAVTSDGTGGMIVAWQDARNLGNLYDIYAQHVVSSGQVDGAWPLDGRILCSAPRSQAKPDLCGDGAGGAIVVWHDDRGSTRDIYCMHVLASGVVDPAWPVNGRALCAATGTQSNARIVSDDAGGAIAIWEDHRSPGTAIYAQHISSSGIVDPSWPVDGRAVASTSPPLQLVADGAGGIVVLSLSTNVHALHVLANGTLDPSWPAGGRALFASSSNHGSPRLIADGSGGAFVVAQEERTDNGEEDIYAAHVLASGQLDPAWPALGLPVCTAAGNQQLPVIAAAGSSALMVAWEDRPDANESDIFAQRVRTTGSIDPTWPARGKALSSYPGFQVRPELVACGSGEVIAVWEDSRGVSESDLFAAHILASGALDPIWPLNGRAISLRPGNQWTPRLASDGSSRAIIAWWDVNSDVDIYAQSTLETCQPGLMRSVVSPLCSGVGAILSEPGFGFTPGDSVELHFIRPDGLPDLPNPTESTNACGNYWHSYNSSTASIYGTYSYYAVDRHTGQIGNTVQFQILPPTRPAPPPGVRVESRGNGTLRISWNADTSPFVEGHDLYRSSPGQSMVILNGTPAGAGYYDDLLATPGIPFTYYLQSYDCAGFGAISAGVTGTSGCTADLVVDSLSFAQVLVSQPLVSYKPLVVRAYLRNAGAPLGANAAIQARLSVRHQDGSVTTKMLDKPFIWHQDGTFSDADKQDGLNTCNFYFREDELTESSLQFWVDIDTDDAVCETNELNNSTAAAPVSRSFLAAKRLRVAYCTMSSSFKGSPTDAMRGAGALFRKVFPVYVPPDGGWSYAGHVTREPFGLGDVSRLSLFLNEINDGLSEDQAYARLVAFVSNWGSGCDLGNTHLQTKIIRIRADAFQDRWATAVAHELGHTYGLVNEEYYYQKDVACGVETQDAWKTPDGQTWSKSPCPSSFPCENYPTQTPSQGVGKGRFVDLSSFDPEARKPAAWCPTWWRRTVGSCHEVTTGNPNVIKGWECGAGPAGGSNRRLCMMGSATLGDGGYWITGDDYAVLTRVMVSPPALTASAPPERAVTANTQLWMAATITAEDHVEAPEWYVRSSLLSPETLFGTGYSVQQVTGSGSVLASEPFGLDFGAEDTLVVAGRLAFAPGTRRVDILKGNTVLYSRAVSSSAPSVSLIQPSGSGILGLDVHVAWTAHDVDGDSIRTNLFYSIEDGAGWFPIAFGVTGTTFSWNTSDVAPSNQIRIKVVVTDGFWAAEDVSDSTFIVAPNRLEASISSPMDSSVFLRGARVTLAGVLTRNGGWPVEGATFSWFTLQGDSLGMGATLDVDSLAPGIHRIELVARDQAESARDTVVMTVQADRDGDGMPDSWEDLYPSLSADVVDDAGDADGDSLVNQDEFAYQTSPESPDTDHDGWSDYREVRSGTDPLSSESTPLSSVADGPRMEVALLGYPNPFRSQTVVHFTLPKAASVELGVYDVAGRLVRQLERGPLMAGTHDHAWNGLDQAGVPVSPGLFFVRLRALDKELVVKTTRLR